MPESFRNKGKIPDWWKYLPVSPEFGSLIDEGGRKVLFGYDYLEDEEIYREELAEKTSRGGIIVEQTNNRETRIVAEDLGIALIYDHDGKLKRAVVGLMNYLSNVDNNTLELVGGEDMIDMMQELDTDRKELNFIFNLDEKFLLVVNANGQTVTKEYFVTDLDYRKGERFEIGYGEHIINLAMRNEEDVFLFGMKVTKTEETDREIKVITRVLSDCNIKTFLDIRTPDKVERLARRIFF